ncbi:hypothetical protein LJR235_001634 [Pararhizobium sp. LjRoot235]|uniref:hypothetical protein n=1 Tax=Pararhizobium sp. LjRoot235 TaxID=3342291 RepID=UPI003ECD2E3E
MIFGVTGGQKAYRERRKTTIIAPGPTPQKLPGAAPKYPGRTNQLQPLIACVKYRDGIKVIHMLENHAA